MIYRGTEDGFKAEDFHGKCDYKGSTLGILKTESKDGEVRKSGWYTDIQWNSDFSFHGEYKAGSGNSFIFLLRDDIKFIILRCKNKEKELYRGRNMCFSIGLNALNVNSDCSIDDRCSSYLGDYYELPSAYEHYAVAGTYRFKILEMEVYKML